jgi:hypothetical protein
VACPAATSCTAIGDYTDNNGHYQGLIETLASRTWAATTAPEPADVAKAGTVFAPSYYAIACPASGSCTALGIYVGFDAVARGVFETLSKGTWTAADAPLPANANGNPAVFMTGSEGTDTLACPAAGSCTAVGGYTDANGKGQALIETLINGTWTATEAPLPANAASNSGASLGAVACPPASSCTAIGNYTDANGHDQGLVETQQ